MVSSSVTVRKLRMGLVFCSGLLFFAGTAFADYYFEILNVSGVATQKVADTPKKQLLAQGNILTANTWIEVEDGGFVDLALDREWQNTIRIGEKTKVFLTALFPTGFYLEHGDLFAKLDELPKDSTLEIQTPVAVAAVRGTTFRVLHRGQTKIENYSASTVFVFGITSFRSMYGEPVQVADNQTTDISDIGTQPASPRPMTEQELKAGLELSSGIKRSIEQSESAGRVGTIQTVEEVTRQYTQDLDRRVKVYMAEVGDPNRKKAGVKKETPTEEADLNSLTAVLQKLGSAERLPLSQPLPLQQGLIQGPAVARPPAFQRPEAPPDDGSGNTEGSSGGAN